MAGSKNYVSGSLTFLNAIGEDGFAEAERLLELDVSKVRETVFDIAQLCDLPGVKLVNTHTHTHTYTRIHTHLLIPTLNHTRVARGGARRLSFRVQGMLSAQQDIPV
jgi:hypothetical protein